MVPSVANVDITLLIHGIPPGFWRFAPVPIVATGPILLVPSAFLGGNSYPGGSVTVPGSHAWPGCAEHVRADKLTLLAGWCPVHFQVSTTSGPFVAQRKSVLPRLQVICPILPKNGL